MQHFAAFFTLLTSSDPFDVWFIWDHLGEKYREVSVAWRWLKHVKAVYSSFKAKPLRSSRLRLPAAWPKLLVRFPVLSCLIIDLCLICVTIWQQLHLICVTFVLQYCLSVYVRLVFFESLWNDVCPGMSGVLKACPKSKGHFEKVEAQLYSPTIVTVHIACLQTLGGPFKFGLSRGCDMLWHFAKFMAHGISWLKRKDAESGPGNALHKL